MRSFSALILSLSKGALLALLWFSPLLIASESSYAASPTIDGTCGTGAANTACAYSATTGGGTTATVSVTSSSAAGCLDIFIGNSKGSLVSVSSIAKTSGTGTVGGFTPRATVNGSGTGQFGTSTVNLEEWSAAWSGGALSGAVITVTLSAALDATSIQAYAVTGTYNNICSFDPHAAATAQINLSGGGPPTYSNVTQTTTDAHDLLIGTSATDAFLASGTSTFGGVSGTPVNSGTNFANGSCCANAIAGSYLGVSAAQAGITTSIAFFGTATYNSVVIADALTSDAPAATGGTYRTLTGAGK